MIVAVRTGHAKWPNDPQFPSGQAPDTRLTSSFEGVYIRASDGLVTPTVAEYNYGANWVTCTDGDSHPLDHHLASLHDAGALTNIPCRVGPGNFTPSRSQIRT